MENKNNNSGIMFIMRGLPGSGKDFWIKNYMQYFAMANANLLERTDIDRLIAVCSADDYFMEDGKYNFNPAKIGMAHAACQGLCIRALTYRVPVIIINNTNTEVWEFENYILLADMMGYQWELVDIYDGDKNGEELANRNAHGVPMHAIDRMRARYQTVIKDVGNNGLMEISMYEYLEHRERSMLIGIGK